MKLENLLNRIDMFMDVEVYDCFGTLLTNYDGRNSINLEYNDWHVYDFFIKEHEVRIWIEEPEEV